MSEPEPVRGVIPAHAVKRVAQAVMVECGGAAEADALAVVPLLDGQRIAGFEVRCACGRSVIVECVYEDPA
jgi:hypothetical protein